MTDLAQHMLDLFPFLAGVKVNRQWAGLADMTPDFAPIMGRTPVDGFFLDAGWGTWGFKATPVAGETMAATVATNRNHQLIHELRLGSLRALRTHGREGRGVGGPLMKLIPCPLNGLRPADEFVYAGEVRAMPDPAQSLDDADWAQLRVPSQRRAGREARVVVPHALGLLVHRRARHHHRRSPAQLPGAQRKARAMMHRLPESRAGEWIDRDAPAAVAVRRPVATRASPATRSPRRWPRRAS